MLTLSWTQSRGNLATGAELWRRRNSRIGDDVRHKVYRSVIALLLAFGLAGCGHKLVAHNGDTTVNVYPSKEQFDKVQSMKSQGGPVGMLGGLGEGLLAKKIDSNTPVKVLSSDDNGAMVEVTDGPEKGFKGYVAKDNLD